MREPEDRSEQEPSPYLRRSRRIEVRRGAARWRRLLVLGGVAAILAGGALATTAYAVSAYLTTSPRFELKDTIAFGQIEHVTGDQLKGVFARDLGRSIFTVPLDRRREELMALPWVAKAYVMRGWPDRVRVLVEERKPVAFVRTKLGALALIDQDGIILPLPRRGRFPLPVLTGVNEEMPVEGRRKRVATLLALLQDLDREKPKRSGEVSEVDLTDETDAAVTVSAGDSAVLVHLGNTNFLSRYKLFLENVESWREQYGSVRSVDLRYDKQVVVKP